jgi:hypothetical protein
MVLFASALLLTTYFLCPVIATVTPPNGRYKLFDKELGAVYSSVSPQARRSLEHGSVDSDNHRCHFLDTPLGTVYTSSCHTERETPAKREQTKVKPPPGDHKMRYEKCKDPMWLTCWFEVSNAA